MILDINKPSKLARCALIKFNGKIVNKVVRCDTERGYIDYYATDENNHLVVINDNIIKHRIFGVVEIFAPLGFKHEF